MLAHFCPTQNVSPKINTSMIIPTIPVVFPVIISDDVNAVWNEKSLRA